MRQDCHSFLTPEFVYTTTWVRHGTTNSESNFQSSLMAAVITFFRPTRLHCLDYILLYFITIPALFSVAQRLLQLWTNNNLHPHKSKCNMYSSNFRRFCLLIYNEKVSWYPSWIYGIRNKSQPPTVAQLHKYLCPFQWMKDALPYFC